ncbi:hypothetical protein [Flavilitoribacter nigricans]|uniref:Polysaccharide (De)acetylase n=1 Tax=Flavilitoribacter nigricans (strain ATCC 23147 / DSM 23189 / NBRC 102662 / NCIMB 1420 / SS-2) TaxID=1122177 RepID=A0A2D0MZD3_FLAN2|nr:hypothetical protein [Flavilitoribacter nigricans]PHN01488.1 hypothetical protein CRP01_36925 [Flavilitoribacter nigricans DSM 23189 = NBRC 102662]
MSNYLLRILANAPGWRTSRKIIVFESDDWGSIRIPSKEVYEILLKKGVKVDQDIYSKYETLENEEDLEGIFSLLEKYKDSNGNNPCFTALCIVANPDFKKIRSNNFDSYEYETLLETYQRYGRKEKMIKLWSQGIENDLIRPQFHGREHLNVKYWFRRLKDKAFSTTKLAFDLELTGLDPSIVKESRKDYQAAFDIEFPEDIDYLVKVLDSGLDLFNDTFGYRAEYFVPTNGPFNSSLNSILQKKGIRFINTAKLNKEPLGSGKYRRSLRYLGKRNKLGQIYLTRNAFFEPSDVKVADWVSNCLKDISTAFYCKKPAIISTHRVNYSGGLSQANRDLGLKELDRLLKTILRNWPDVEFLTSDQLGRIIIDTK